MATNLGKFLRILRIKKGETLKNMADNLNVSSAFLSAIENGKKKMPETMVNNIITQYNLSSSEIDEFNQSILESSETLELNVKNASATNKRLAVSLARQFDTLDEDTSKEILNILNKFKGA